MRGKTGHVTSGLPAGVTKISQNKRVRAGVDRACARNQLGDGYEDDRTGVFSHRVGGPGSGRAENPIETRRSLEQKCRQMVGKEQYEGEGRSHIGQMQAQRFSDCMIGMPN